jgi:cyclopropane fatty-acyl-phospholipid synthase-like methyltransferase
MTSSTEPAADHTDRVSRFYDGTVAAFERLGQGGASIHRAVWGAGVSSREAAYHYVDELILGALPERGQPLTVVDLGCGLGASLTYLASRRPHLRGEGITISPRQATRAAALTAAANLATRVRCRQGNYLSVPDDLAGQADLTFSIEAFVHSPDAERYFDQAARTLRPGATLIICDDFRTSADPPTHPRAARWLDDFRTGWHAASLLTVDQARTLAAAHGLILVGDLDLTSALELRRMRDRWIGGLLRLGRPFRPSGDYWQSLVGGDALQHALIHGLLSYRFLEFHAR